MPQQVISPDIIGYSAAISSCETEGQWQVALNLFDCLPLTPDAISFNAAISSCEKGSQWHLALHFLNQMARKQITPHTVSFNAALGSCQKMGCWKSALLLEGIMQGGRIAGNVLTYCELMVACVTAEQFQLATLALEQVSKAAMEAAKGVIGVTQNGEDMTPYTRGHIY